MRKHVDSDGRAPRGRRSVTEEAFKNACLRLIGVVNEIGEEIVITRGGTPITMLVPVADADLRPFVGRSQGLIHASREDLLAPLDEHWEVDADL